MKKLLILLCILLTACGTKPAPAGTEITDAFGNTCTIPDNPVVVCGYASFGDLWLLSGGTLAGVTEDAITEHQLDVSEDIPIIGTVKHIDLEKLVALDPDYVLLSADLTAHLSLRESLTAMGIPHGYFRVDVFEDYKALMAQFCGFTGRQDLYQKNVLDVEAEIEAIKARIPKTEDSVLLIRAFSTGMKAKADDNLAGQILQEFGLHNIAEGQMLEDLSLEHIVRTDPDYIFAMTMGNEAGALACLRENAEKHPAWAGLTAIQNGRYHLLPKELFHYKPNERWSESYGYLANLLWPELFSGESKIPQCRTAPDGPARGLYAGLHRQLTGGWHRGLSAG